MAFRAVKVCRAFKKRAPGTSDKVYFTRNSLQYSKIFILHLDDFVFGFSFCLWPYLENSDTVKSEVH